MSTYGIDSIPLLKRLSKVIDEVPDLKPNYDYTLTRQDNLTHLDSELAQFMHFSHQVETH